MDIKEARELFSKYKDNELDENSKIEFEKLLETNQEIKKEYEEFLKLFDSLSMIAKHKAPPDFLKGFHKKISKRSGNKFFSTKKDPQFYWIIYTFIILLLFIIIYLASIYLIDIQR